MSMIDLSTVSHHASVDSISKVLANRTGKQDYEFFRLLTVYYLSVMAASMRAKMVTKDRGEIPVNNYLVALAPSGFGKGRSTNALENELLADFRLSFKDHVLPNKAEQNMWKLASRRAAVTGTDDQFEYDKLNKEFEQCGEYPFVFDGASEPAIKQIRQLLLLSGCGSINYQVDEIGSNIEKSTEALNTYLELYDLGMIKQKLTKNSNDNRRTKEIEGKTPANMLLFGTPDKLLDGGAIEKKFFSLLETGYARRCLFAAGDINTSMDLDLTKEEIYQRRIDPGNTTAFNQWRQHFASLADTDKLDWIIEVPDNVALALIDYEMWCNKRSKDIPQHYYVQRAEMEHRYFKALKVAGTFAFVEETMTMTEDQLLAAIKLVEESGRAFEKICNQDEPYMRLAKYIAAEKKQLTHANLDRLPFYKGTLKERQDLMIMAAAWGYDNHIMIQKSYKNGIEFFSGETLKETNIDQMYLTYSTDWAYHYTPAEAPFNQLHQLMELENYHWANHSFEKNHRTEDNVLPGFNLLVLDIDKGVTLQQAHDLLKDYTFMTYTTKRHTPDQHRFRLILPMNYFLELDQDDYREFMKNIVEWLPFEVDAQANQRSRKWETFHKTTYHYNRESGEDVNFLDILPFIPKTAKNEEHQKVIAELGSLDNLERWFAQRFSEGNRNNNMIRYALALVDAGFSYKEIEDKVIVFNSKISNGLPSDELKRTVLVTVAKKLQGTSP